MSLTEIKVRQARNQRKKIYFLADDDGLSLKVEPNGRNILELPLFTYRDK